MAKIHPSLEPKFSRNDLAVARAFSYRRLQPGIWRARLVRSACGKRVPHPMGGLQAQQIGNDRRGFVPTTRQRLRSSVLSTRDLPPARLCQ
jgi:hypothetical protein